MTKLFLIILLIIGAIIALEILFGSKKKWGYEYKKKNFFMTRSEHEFFDILLSLVGNEFHIFAQVHLSTLLDHKVRGQNWLGAFSHINQQSVDFVLCDKAYVSPKLVIELDDPSHEKQERILKDDEKDRIFINANLPILRIKNFRDIDSNDLLRRIKEAMVVNKS